MPDPIILGFHTTHQDLFGQASQFKSEKQCLNACVLFTVVS